MLVASLQNLVPLATASYQRNLEKSLFARMVPAPFLMRVLAAEDCRTDGIAGGDI